MSYIEVKDLTVHLGEEISVLIRIKKKRQLDDRYLVSQAEIGMPFS